MKLLSNFIPLFIFINSFGFSKTLVVDLPEFLDYMLPNGLRVIVAEHHEQPAVFIEIRIDVGARDVPIGKEGLDDITTTLIQRGTSTHTADEISAIIDATGGSLSGSSDVEYSTFSGKFLIEDFEIGLRMLTDILLSPSLPKKEFKRLIKEEKQNIKSRYSSSKSIVWGHGKRLLFGNTPMGRRTSKSSLSSISFNDVKNFHDYYSPDISTLAIIGDFDLNAAKSLVNELFGKWVNKNTKKEFHAFSPQQIEGIRFRFVENPELEQATIHVLNWGIPYASNDRYSFQIMDYILGRGSFSSRLMKKVRSKYGKTYSIRTWSEKRSDYGTLEIVTSTRSDEVYNTYQLIIDEVDNMKRGGITKDELNQAKSYYSGAYPLEMENPGNTARKILKALYYGDTIEDVEKYLVKINGVTLEEVNAAADKYLDSENFVLVVVGNGEVIKDKLASIGPYDQVFYKDDVK